MTSNSTLSDGGYLPQSEKWWGVRSRNVEVAHSDTGQAGALAKLSPIAECVTANQTP
jgi:hypothetical protein